jgi:hypothetical protein
MPAHIIGTLNDTDSRQIQPRTTKSLSKEEYERHMQAHKDGGGETADSQA